MQRNSNFATIQFITGLDVTIHNVDGDDSRLLKKKELQITALLMGV